MPNQTQFPEFARMERHGWAKPDAATNYRDLFSPITDQSIEPMVAALGSDPKTVLDLCCGHGSLSAAAHAAGHKVVGADFSPAMIAVAQQSVTGPKFQIADAQALPFAENSFDAVLSGFGICHIPDQPRAVQHIARVLKPGGQFGMTIWYGADIPGAFQIMTDAVKSHGDPAIQQPPEPGFHRFADPEIANQVLSQAGFSDITVQKIDNTWALSEPEQLFDIFANATLRFRDLMARQPDKNRAAIRNAVGQAIAATKPANGAWVVPQPAALVQARI